MRTFIIAEIGVNHNGRVDLALELVERIAAAGAHAAKLQTFRADKIAAQGAPTVAYQADAYGATDQHAMLRELELDEDGHRQVAQRCADLGIEFMSTAFDQDSLDFLCDLGIRRIKSPSGEITNHPYLQDCARRGLPMIVSTGMSTLEEVREACAIVQQASPLHQGHGLNAPLTVLHCTSAYPTALEDVNLSAINLMARELGLPIGYSDHTVGIVTAPLAVALGATMIEKHVTLDRGMRGPDHSASIEPDGLRALVEEVAQVETIMGEAQKQPAAVELEARNLVRRGLKAARALPAGAVLTAGDIAILRPASGLAPRALSETIGRRLAVPKAAGEPLHLVDFADV